VAACSSPREPSANELTAPDSAAGGFACRNFVSINDLPSFTTAGPFAIESRNHHEDYWLWEPTCGAPTKLKKNLDKILGACVVITDNSLVVATSENGVADIRLAKQVANTATVA